MSSAKVPRRADEADFVRMVERYGDGLLRMCCLYLNDRALAEDAVQDTFVKAYRALGRFRGECDEKTWLTGIAINTCKNYRRNPWHRFVDRAVEMERMPERGTGDDPGDGEVLRQIAHLSKAHREVVLLYYYQELPAREIAGLLNISEEAVYARLARARRKLKTRLEGWFFDA
ncbi:MAG: sigma-70 family RNA polymerase sigma factor [Clostridiales bacterium]|nr:sigma-70 family RNA polymerase sigma factor [Clostridiales bacterium]